MKNALKHRLLGRLSKRAAWRLREYGRQLCGLLMKRIEPHLRAGRDRPAEEIAVVVAAVNCDRGARIDDHAGLAHLLICGSHVKDTVDAGLLRGFGEHAYRNVDLPANPLYFLAGDLLDDVLKRLDERRINS